MSQLNGIMNIEAGVDGDHLVQLFLTKLNERGVDITAEQFSPSLNRWRTSTPPPIISRLRNMLGDGLVPSNAKAGYLGLHASLVACCGCA